MRGEGVGSLGCRRGVTDFSLEDDFPKAAPLAGGRKYIIAHAVWRVYHANATYFISTHVCNYYLYDIESVFCFYKLA